MDLRIFEFKDHFPPPEIKRKTRSTVIAKSVRYSCANGQKPFSTRRGHLVVTKAVIMIMRGGMAATLVIKPIRINELQSIEII